MLATHDLRYRYPGGREFSFPDLSVGAGEAILLLGPSGAGKSTWLHLLAGILTPIMGGGGARTRVLGDTDYGKLTGGELDRFRGRHIGLVLQRSYFVEALTVIENLALARRLGGLPVVREELYTLLDELDIGRYADRRPRRLSVGEQQRTTIARALVNRPKLLLADEPTSALDARNAARVSDLLRTRARALNAALLVVTHDERLRPDFDRVVELSSLPTP